MATTFEITIAQEGVDKAYARSAANAVFAEIERLEDELSCHRAVSDVYRLSQLKAGESATVGLAAWDCLSLAKAVYAETSGAFDITIGPLMHLWRNEDGTPRQPDDTELDWARERVGSHLFELDHENLRIMVHCDHVVFDLGAIGKGYALDQAVQTLDDWSISSALLNAGDSTVLGVGSPPGDPGWVVNLAGEYASSLCLTNRALSCSGFAVKGNHIMNPRTLAPVPVRPLRSYVAAPTAAMSDALSTAFMVMSEPEIEALCKRHPEIEVIVP